MTREDKDAIIRRIEAMYGEAEDNETKEALFYAIEALKEQSIIHCKDCEYYRTPEKYSYKEPNLYCCRSAFTKVSENDFCSKAIRKEGDRNENCD